MTASPQDLKDLLRLADGPVAGFAAPGAKLRWISPPALALLLARWISREGRIQSLWVDAPSEAEARTLAQDLHALLPSAGVVHFPGFAPYAGGESSPPGMVLRERLSALVGLLERRVQVLVTGPLTACEKLPHPSWFQKQKLDLNIGTEVPRELLLETLVALGYRRVEMASAPGEFSSRGMVVDLWPDHLEQPLRLETFGDELERLSPFDPDTQRRTGEALTSLALYPRFEGDRGNSEALLAAVAARADRTQEPEDDLAFRRTRLATHDHFPGEELFHPMLGQPKGQLVHWVPPCLRVRLESAWEASLRDAERMRIEAGLVVLRRGGVVCPDFEDRFLPGDPSRPSFQLTEWQSEATVPLAAQPPREFQGRIPELATHLQDLILKNHRVFLAGSTPGMRDRFQELLRDHELPLGRGLEPGCRAIHLALSAGVQLSEPGMVVFTEREIYGRKVATTAPKKSRSAAFLSDLRDLKPGDRIVHLDHGIGEFMGFATLTVGGEEQEVMRLRYADGGQLHVNLERADLVQRYTGAEGHLPPLDKLGGASWAKVKRKAKKAIRDMADELLKLYAQRKLEKGHAYPPDGPDMAAFDASFPYTLTPDQVEAIEAVKADLESPRPMDRLLVGDVGFGKTEVAMRAAAKVALEGKQVAVLCPTTILCFQHFRTFKERFAGFPIKIEMLNRFVEPAEQKRILQEAADGKIEIVIGTHQMLGARVKFADLGLVVIDEEQRFGVGHKEKLKKLRLNVDQLALSATPIPRTLHMSLTGLREISLIETPPKDRLAIETVVAPWSDELVQTAIQFELRRGGQVYLVHNRVESIVSIAARVRELVPDARVGVGHGQLTDEGLEQVMLAFMEGRIDVLVATTIVENGLDVPNANTLIVHRADAFGLSQLYQLRGRVGRSDVPAYAYLMIPGPADRTGSAWPGGGGPGGDAEGVQRPGGPHRSGAWQISEDARKRLQALEDFSELGSGFRVAAMDLELRGAGNLLGGEQSGHIHDIGFELYVRLLEETLQELQGQPSGAFEVKLDGLAPGAQLSRRWIDQASERLVAYKRISRFREERDIDLYRLDLEDRFGHIHDEDADTQRFFELLKVKVRAQALAVAEIAVDKGQLKFRLSPITPLDPVRMMAWVGQQKGAHLSPDGTLRLPLLGSEESALIQAQRILAAWTQDLA